MSLYGDEHLNFVVVLDNQHEVAGRVHYLIRVYCHVNHFLMDKVFLV